MFDSHAPEHHPFETDYIDMIVSRVVKYAGLRVVIATIWKEQTYQYICTAYPHITARIHNAGVEVQYEGRDSEPRNEDRPEQHSNFVAPIGIDEAIEAGTPSPVRSEEGGSGNDT